MKVFITGATGFLGYHVANMAVSEGHEVFCLRRSTSVSLFDKAIEERISWLNNDDHDWKKKLASFQPEVLIHCAWGGVRGAGRDDYEVQQLNVELSRELFEAYPYKQIIAIGSQAEYGYYDSIVSENHPLNPENEYGRAKVDVSKLLQAYSEAHGIEWQWIRIFTVFGEKQKAGLIYGFAQKCLSGAKTFDTSPGMQVYSYMYSFDFAKSIIQMMGAKGKSGTYNLSQLFETHTNRDILESIKRIMHSDITINYGAFDYAPNQVMRMEGYISKFEKAFGEIPHSDFMRALENTINSYNA